MLGRTVGSTASHAVSIDQHAPAVDVVQSGTIVSSDADDRAIVDQRQPVRLGKCRASRHGDGLPPPEKQAAARQCRQGQQHRDQPHLTTLSRHGFASRRDRDTTARGSSQHLTLAPTKLHHASLRLEGRCRKMRADWC